MDRKWSIYAGFALTSIQVILTKVISLVGQLGLAWYLVPSDFGYVAAAMTIATITGFVQFSGCKEFLLQRSTRLYYWLPHAQSCTLILGLVSVLMAAFLAYLLRDQYSFPDLVSLSAMQAAANSINAYGLIIGVNLQVESRYKLMNASGLLHSIINIAGAVFFAYLGTGAFAVTLGLLFAAFARLMMHAYIERTHLAIRWRVRYWAFFLNSGLFTFAASVCGAASTQMSAGILGLFTNAAEVGFYFFAYNLSAQIIQLLSINTAQVLLPALANARSHGQDADVIYRRVTSITAFVITPLCLIQASVAWLIISLFFREAWRPSADILAILSLGMIPQAISISFASRMQSVRRWRALFYVSAGNAVIFLLALAIGAHLGGGFGAACCLSIAFWIVSPINVLISIGRSDTLPWVRSLFGRPAIATVGVAVALVSAHYFSENEPYAVVLAVPAASGIAAVVLLVMILYKSELSAVIRLIRSRKLSQLSQFPI